MISRTSSNLGNCTIETPNHEFYPRAQRSSNSFPLSPYLAKRPRLFCIQPNCGLCESESHSLTHTTPCCCRHGLSGPASPTTLRLIAEKISPASLLPLP